MTESIKAAWLASRGVVRVAGETARGFLNNLLTAEIAHLAPGAPRYAALLTPQGKIIADFLVVQTRAEDGGDVLLDCPKALAPLLVERLNFYKLRAKVRVEDLSERLGVMAIWNGAKNGESEYGLVYPDPRLSALGARAILPPGLAQQAASELGAMWRDEADYEAHRIALGVPRGGLDFIYGETFPHDADLDRLNGVDFKKGCFVGQEVVSRVEHRGTARNRIVPVAFEGPAAETGSPVMGGEIKVGVMGSSANMPGGALGLAMLRLDRVQELLTAGTTLTSGGLALRLRPSMFADSTQTGTEKTSS
jgi:folate-binding protein YgfZ